LSLRPSRSKIGVRSGSRTARFAGDPRIWRQRQSATNIQPVKTQALSDILPTSWGDQMSHTMQMSRKRRSIKSSLLFASAVSGCFCLALWTHASSAASDASQASPSTNYVPSISDFMIATIQPRHVRLWIAARSADWSFAAYELGNLKGAFDRLGRTYPMEHEIPLQDMISSVTAQPFEDISKAIESKDAIAFSKAYGDLTSACNSCHQATNHGVVVIRAPSESSISDQEFGRPAP
jgi:hypothetical protein